MSINSKERLLRGAAILGLHAADQVLGGSTLTPALEVAAKQVVDSELLDLEIAMCDQEMADFFARV